jgi:hypothetical protein
MYPEATERTTNRQLGVVSRSIVNLEVDRRPVNPQRHARAALPLLPLSQRKTRVDPPNGVATTTPLVRAVPPEVVVVTDTDTGLLLEIEIARRDVTRRRRKTRARMSAGACLQAKRFGFNLLYPLRLLIMFYTYRSSSR